VVAMALEKKPCRTLYLPEIATTGGARLCEGVFHVRNPVESGPQFSAIRFYILVAVAIRIAGLKPASLGVFEFPDYPCVVQA